MTRPKIQLPIKCSNLKKIDRLLDRIINLEYKVYTVVGTIFLLHYLIWGYLLILNGSRPHPLDGYTFGLLILAAVGMSEFVNIFIPYCAESIYKIYNNIPTFECIKDEE